jgi:hypothetical protein
MTVHCSECNQELGENAYSQTGLTGVYCSDQCLNLANERKQAARDAIEEVRKPRKLPKALRGV